MCTTGHLVERFGEHRAQLLVGRHAEQRLEDVVAHDRFVGLAVRALEGRVLDPVVLDAVLERDRAGLSGEINRK